MRTFINSDMYDENSVVVYSTCPFIAINRVPPTRSYQCSLCLSVHLSSSRFQPASHRGSGRHPGALNVRQLFVGRSVVEAEVRCLKTVGLIRV